MPREPIYESTDPRAFEGCGVIPDDSVEAKMYGQQYPVDGFFMATTRTNKPWGLGFYCQTCHHLIQGGLQPGARIFHCGHSDEAPGRTFWSRFKRLPVVRRVVWI